MACFRSAAAEAERAPSIASHRAAIDLYGGELLPEDRFDEHPVVPPLHRIDGEEHARLLRVDHALDDDGHPQVVE